MQWYPSGRLPQHRKAVLRNDIEYFVRIIINERITKYVPLCLSKPKTITAILSDFTNFRTWSTPLFINTLLFNPSLYMIARVSFWQFNKKHYIINNVTLPGDASYASFLTSQSPHATIACLMLAYSFSPRVQKYPAGSPYFHSQWHSTSYGREPYQKLTQDTLRHFKREPIKYQYNSFVNFNQLLSHIPKSTTLYFHIIFSCIYIY